jgi:hypothetical protein
MFVATSIVGAQVPQRNLKTADNRKSATTAVKQSSEARNFSYADKVTVFFHGLMVGRFNADPKRLEVGIVKDAPDHKFEVKVRDEDGNFQTFDSSEKYWSFEVQDKTGKPVSSSLLPYQPKPNFDRMAPVDARYREDFRYVADMEGEGFYNTALERKAGAFSRIVHIANGSVRSKCLTAPLQNRKGDGAWQDYGRMAEILGVDIELKPGQSLVLNVSNANQPQREVWRWTYQSGRTAETAVLNIPSEHHPLTSGNRSNRQRSNRKNCKLLW